MNGATTGGVKWLLRAEGLCVLIAGILAYAKFGTGWGIFALFFFAPDISFLGYLAGTRVGAIVYNAAHSYMSALLTLIAGVYFEIPLMLTAGIIWTAHIGFDRIFGYGLKYATGFGFTHLG